MLLTHQIRIEVWFPEVNVRESNRSEAAASVANAGIFSYAKMMGGFIAATVASHMPPITPCNCASASNLSDCALI